ncbi:MAG: MFS transporter [Chloroflexota bacterium]
MLSKKWFTLFALAFAQLLALAVWFSASAVVPLLTDEWGLVPGQVAWLTMTVQIGFVVGALVSTLLNLADRLPSRYMLPASAILAGLATAFIPLFEASYAFTLVLRFLTGFFLAGVYPVGMKLMATWTKTERGLAIGLLVGALTIGSALPHLLNIFGDLTRWEPVMWLSAALAISGGIIGFIFVKEGPYAVKSPPFDWRQIGYILRDRDVMSANFGYLGHMWELYAMWAWISLFLLDSFAQSGIDAFWVGPITFAVIAIGGLGSLLAGRLADHFGRTRTTIVSLSVSSLCAISIGFFFGASLWFLVPIALIWGFAIVADSAQFSAAVSELAPQEYIGTALTLQTSLGFLLTLFTIRMVPPLQAAFGWRYAFMFLAIGPIIGIWAMFRLYQSPASLKCANGNR